MFSKPFMFMIGAYSRRTIKVLLVIIFFSCTSSSKFQPLPEQPKTETNPRAELALDPAEYTELIWSDEFNGTSVDQTKWSAQTGTGCNAHGCGWGNHEKQSYTDHEKNVRVSGGSLVITAMKEAVDGAAYSSARLRSKDKGDWAYGKIEVRAKLPKGQGIWPAIWMLPTDEEYGPWPKSGEIDIMEMRGQKPATVLGTAHYGQDWPGNKNKTGEYHLEKGDFTDDFHVFSIIKSKDKVRWYVDGNLFYTITPTDMEPEKFPLNIRFHVLLNLAVGGDFLGDPDATTVFPQQMLVDYVRVYHPK